VSAAPHGGSKGSVAEGGIKVPAIVAGPALGIRRGERSAALMTIRDLPVSLLALAGVKAPDS
jgi:arylsulfatase